MGRVKGSQSPCNINAQKGKGSESMGHWYTEAVSMLTEHARSKDLSLSSKSEDSNARSKQRQNALAEAQSRSALLSTSADKVGVSFSGAVFQERYFATKFERRGVLLFEILGSLESLLRGKDEIHVASFGGGPGTDASGLVWVQRKYLPHTVFHCTLYDREKTWKRYLKVLQSLFGSMVSVDFAACDVTQPLGVGANYRVSIGDADLLLFFYVCNETSVHAEASDHVFYVEVATSAKPGSLLIIADVVSHSKGAISKVVSAIKSARACDDITLGGNHNAEVVVLKLL